MSGAASPATTTSYTDPASAESLAYMDIHRPLVRRLWSVDHRPVLDFTLPVVTGDPGLEKLAGDIRVGFYAGSRGLNWAAPPPA